MCGRHSQDSPTHLFELETMASAMWSATHSRRHPSRNPLCCCLLGDAQQGNSGVRWKQCSVSSNVLRFDGNGLFQTIVTLREQSGLISGQGVVAAVSRQRVQAHVATESCWVNLCVSTGESLSLVQDENAHICSRGSGRV